MKLIKPSFQILEQKPGLEGIYEMIETAGRCCYKSTRPEGRTAKGFVDMLIKNKHYAMLEHGTVYLDICLPHRMPLKEYGYFINHVDDYRRNPYSRVFNFENDKEQHYYITSNLRVLLEHNWLDDLKYLCEPIEYHENRVTVHFITSIGIGRELLRHRVFSFANESTRYCNYSSEKKFGGEITFIQPSWLGKYSSKKLDETGHRKDGTSDMFIAEELADEFKEVETRYMAMIIAGCSPQEAREVLPLATKSELIMTGFVSDWDHLFSLRSSIAATGQPHPDMRALIDPLMQEFINRKYING